MTSARQRVLARIGLAFGRWRTTLGFATKEPVTLGQVRLRYRQLSLAAHPDRGGATETQVALNRAFEQAKRDLA